MRAPPLPFVPRPALSPPRLPAVDQALGRIRLPDDLEAVTSVGAERPPQAAGLSERQVRRIWSAAQSLYRTGVHPALALCVRRHGHVVLDRAIGHARGNGPADPPDAPKEPATPRTPFCVYSTSKGITALLVHMLHERGELDILDPVTRYIPEYGVRGKERTTIAHVLAHRAGVPTIPRALLDLERVGDREFIIATLCRARPLVKPGTLLAYHALSGGFILGEIVQRVTGESVRELLAREILDPLGFRYTNYGVAPEDVQKVGLSYVTGPRLLPPLSLLAGRALGAPLEQVVSLSNDPRFLTSVIPAASIITTAEELSRFFEIFRRGGELDGVRVMAPETLRRALTEQARLELDLTLVLPGRFSYGLMLGAKLISLFGLDTDLAFGHLGLINIMGWADPERGLACGLITSGKALLYPELHRFYMVMQRIASEVPKVPESQRPF
jgi:CubicO group peptidase (beta-lactamase class C family)